MAARMLTVIALGLLAVTFPVVVLAADGGVLESPQPIDAGDADGRRGILLAPVRFDPEEAAPGTELRYELTVRNTTEEPIRVAPRTLPLEGSDDPRRFVQVARTGAPGAAVRWASYPGFGMSRVLAPGRGLRYPVAVRVPEDASPGTYAVGLGLAQAVSAPGLSTENRARVQLDAVPASVAVVRVAGIATAEARIRDIRAPRVVWMPRRATFVARVENVGQTDLVLDAEVDLSSFLGRAGRTLDAEGPAAGQPTLPGGVRELRMRWNDPPLLGWFAPELVVVGGAGSDVRITDDLETVFVVPPWWLCALLVLAVVLPVRARRRRRRRPGAVAARRARAASKVEARLRRGAARRRATERRRR